MWTMSLEGLAERRQSIAPQARLASFNTYPDHNREHFSGHLLLDADAAVLSGRLRSATCAEVYCGNMRDRCTA